MWRLSPACALSVVGGAPSVGAARGGLGLRRHLRDEGRRRVRIVDPHVGRDHQTLAGADLVGARQTVGLEDHADGNPEAGGQRRCGVGGGDLDDRGPLDAPAALAQRVRRRDRIGSGIGRGAGSNRVEIAGLDGSRRLAGGRPGKQRSVGKTGVAGRAARCHAGHRHNQNDLRQRRLPASQKATAHVLAPLCAVVNSCAIKAFQTLTKS